MSSSSRGILAAIVAESLEAFPENAQLKVEEYLTDNGLAGDDIDMFRKCWTKTVLGHESFGVKNKKDYKIKSEQFASDFIDEMLKHDNDLQQLSSMIVNLQNELQQLKSLKSARDEIEGDDSVTDSKLFDRLTYHSNLKANLNAMYKSTLGGDIMKDNVLKQQIRDWKYQNSLQLKYHIQYYRLQHVKHSDQQVLYTPLHLHYHQQTALSFGEYIRKSTAPVLTSEEKFPIETVVSVSVKSSPHIEKRAWTTFQALSDVLIYTPMSIFPLPISANQDSSTFERTFTFENPPVKRLGDILSASLAVFLRKYPSVLQLWMNQLYIARISLLSSSYQLINQPSVDDVFIRNDGRMLIGNIAFDEIDVVEGFEDDDFSIQDFDRWAFNTISEALCLSRSLSMEFVSADSIDGDTKVLYICQGKKLVFNIPARLSKLPVYLRSDERNHSNDLPYILVSIDGGESKNSESSVYVSDSRAAVKSVSLEISDSNEREITVNAKSPGTITLSVRTKNCTADELCELNLVVVPHHVIASAEVLESLEAVELAFTMRDPSTMFLASGKLWERRIISYIHNNSYSSQAMKACDDWLAVCDAVNRLAL